jgi:NAD(P)-dependent dehydrogenase (short-subunit alcohol dehydrogenase family)
MKIEGKAALVSGGGSGIGRAVVLALAERGAMVVIADVDDVAGQQTIELVAGMRGTAMFAHCDVTRTADLNKVVEHTVERFGQLDIVFNNAGIGGVALFADDSDAFKRVIDVDLAAVINATRIAVRKMKQLGTGGVIINTASLIGLFPMAAAPVYGAAKAGVIHFTRSLADLADESNIRVNAICPELVDTPMAVRGMGEEAVKELRAAGDILTPEDIAASVLELIIDDTRAGQIMQITKGHGREYVAFDR